MDENEAEFYRPAENKKSAHQLGFWLIFMTIFLRAGFVSFLAGAVAMIAIALPADIKSVDTNGYVPFILIPYFALLSGLAGLLTGYLLSLPAVVAASFIWLAMRKRMARYINLYIVLLIAAVLGYLNGLLVSQFMDVSQIFQIKVGTKALFVIAAVITGLVSYTEIKEQKKCEKEVSKN